MRSGKTWISLVLWALWVAQMPNDGYYLMCARTLDSLKRNCLSVLEDLVGSKRFTYSMYSKEGTLFGRKIYLEGASDVRSEEKIRGMTLSGVYCDEITLFPQEFFSMLKVYHRIYEIGKQHNHVSHTNIKYAIEKQSQ